MAQANAKSKSEKFPPPHQDGAVGHHADPSRRGPVSFGPDASFGSPVFNSKSSTSTKSTIVGGARRRRKSNNEDNPQMAPSRRFIRPFNPSSLKLSMDLLFKGKSEVFGSRR